VREAVATAKATGVRSVIIADDHPLTARQITWELDVAAKDQPLHGCDLAEMSVDDEEPVGTCRLNMGVEVVIVT
jgi:magnesium-transporting ATPase (P-type)